MDPRTSRLFRWYRTHKRDLPWRTTHDAYRIFISELMLQQTQVDRVIPKYHDFLKQFPTWHALAAAKTGQLIHAWAGLGYNRRALYARDAARDVVAHGVPKTQLGWRKLKGVGPYMAAVLAEFVNHERALVIDTNVRRVVGRLILGSPFPRPSDDGQILNVLETLTPKQRSHWILPHAFMDFGSAMCVARNPRCTVCPFRRTCRSAQVFLYGTAEQQKKRIRPTERIHRDKPHPDRIYRGKILQLIRTSGPQRVVHLGERIDPTYDAIADADWVHAMAERLVKDGLLEWKTKDILSLPK